MALCKNSETGFLAIMSVSFKMYKINTLKIAFNINLSPVSVKPLVMRYLDYHKISHDNLEILSAAKVVVIVFEQVRFSFGMTR